MEPYRVILSLFSVWLTDYIIQNSTIWFWSLCLKVIMSLAGGIFGIVQGSTVFKPKKKDSFKGAIFGLAMTFIFMPIMVGLSGCLGLILGIFSAYFIIYSTWFYTQFLQNSHLVYLMIFVTFYNILKMEKIYNIKEFEWHFTAILGLIMAIKNLIAHCPTWFISLLFNLLTYNVFESGSVPIAKLKMK